LVRETYEPGMNVSLVARKHGVGASQLINWGKLEQEGALTVKLQEVIRTRFDPRHRGLASNTLTRPVPVVVMVLFLEHVGMFQRVLINEAVSPFPQG